MWMACRGKSVDTSDCVLHFTLYSYVHRVVMSSPQTFFDIVKDCGTEKLCRWVGELYLELHRGTYTTQAEVMGSEY